MAVIIIIVNQYIYFQLFLIFLTFIFCTEIFHVKYLPWAVIFSLNICTKRDQRKKRKHTVAKIFSNLFTEKLSDKKPM